MIVMCICHFDDTNSSGGLDKQARLLSRTLQDKQQELVVLASTRKFSRAGWAEMDGLRVRFFWTYTTPQVSGKKLPASLLWALQVLLWTCFHRKRITVFHSHQIRIHAFVGAIAQKFWGIPHVLKSATGGAGADIKAIGSHKYFGAGGRRFIIRNTHTFIATTQSIKEDLLQYGVTEDQIELIPNGLILPQTLTQGPAHRHTRCIFLGRLASDKNILNLARAAEASMRGTDFHLDIYGKGELQPVLEQLLQEMQARHVSYRGFANDTLALLPNYGWLLLPSEAEGLSNAMLEAMACGVVPVATRVSGCVDHITPGETGYFFAGTDEQALQAGIDHLCSLSAADWSVLTDKVSLYARGRFAIEKIADAYIDLYRRLRMIPTDVRETI